MDYYDFFAGGMVEVENEPLKQVALLPGERPNDTEDLVTLLREHEIEVYRTNRKLKSEGVNYLTGGKGTVQLPEGTFIVPMAQPMKRLAKVLLERNVDIQQEFLDEALAAYEYNKSVGENAPKQRLGFYDVTAWSLPLTYGIETYGLTSSLELNNSLSQVAGEIQTEGGVAQEEDANYAYIFPYNTNDAAGLMSRLMAEGYRVAMATKPFVTNGKSYDRGVVVVRVERNPGTLHERIRTLAKETGTIVEAVDASWTEEGILLGSRNVVNLKMPKILVLMDEPTRGRSYGAIWYTLEHLYGVPFTAIRTSDFNSINLNEYDMVIMPPGSSSGYKRVLGATGIEKLQSWVKGGGTFIGIGDGAEFATDEQVDMSSSRQLQDLSEEKMRIPQTPGAIMRVSLDTNHYLTLGYGNDIPVHVNSSRIFSPSREGANVGVFDGQSRVSGFVFDDNKGNFPGSAYLIHERMGRGNVVLFAEQPVFRLYWRGLERLFINSVLLTPGF